MVTNGVFSMQWLASPNEVRRASNETRRATTISTGDESQLEKPAIGAQFLEARARYQWRRADIALCPGT